MTPSKLFCSAIEGEGFDHLFLFPPAKRAPLPIEVRVFAGDDGKEIIRGIILNVKQKVP